MSKYKVCSSDAPFVLFSATRTTVYRGIGNGGAVCVTYLGLIYQAMHNATDFEVWWRRTMLANRYGVDDPPDRDDRRLAHGALPEGG